MRLKEKLLIYLDLFLVFYLQDLFLKSLKWVENIIIVLSIMKIKFKAQSLSKLFKDIDFIGRIAKDLKYPMLLQLLLSKRENAITDPGLILLTKINFNFNH